MELSNRFHKHSANVKARQISPRVTSAARHFRAGAVGSVAVRLFDARQYIEYGSTPVQVLKMSPEEAMALGIAIAAAGRRAARQVDHFDVTEETYSPVDRAARHSEIPAHLAEYGYADADFVDELVEVVANSNKYESMEVFLAADERRMHSREADFGVNWQGPGWRQGMPRQFPVWRVTHLEATDELIAVQAQTGRVIVLATIPSDRVADGEPWYSQVINLLDGWADYARSLDWISERLSS